MHEISHAYYLLSDMSDINSSQLDAIVAKLLESKVRPIFGDSNKLIDSLDFIIHFTPGLDPHIWKHNLRDMVRMLECEIDLPHGEIKLVGIKNHLPAIYRNIKINPIMMFASSCEECNKAYNLRRQYQQQKPCHVPPA